MFKLTRPIQYRGFFSYAVGVNFQCEFENNEMKRLGMEQEVAELGYKSCLDIAVAR